MNQTGKKFPALPRRWVICGMCVLLLCCTMGFTNSGFSVYLPFMRAFSGITNTQCSTILMVRNLASFIALFFIDRYLERTDVRLGVTIGTGCTAAAFLLYALSRSFPMYCVAAAITGVAHTLGGMIPVSLLINRWFDTHQALALGLCAAGSGVAAIVIPPTITAIIHRASLPAAFAVESVIALLIGIGVYLTLRNQPERSSTAGASPKGVPHQTHTEEHLISADSKSMVFICASMLLLSISLYGTVPNLTLLFTGQGMEAATAAYLVSLFGMALTLGKCLFGYLSDRFGPHRTSGVFFLLVIVGMIGCALTSANSLLPSVAGVFTLGVGNALTTVALPIFAKDLSGPDDYTRKSKQLQLSYTMGSIATGPFPGLIADRTGSFVPAFLIFAAFACIAALAALFSLCFRNRQLKRLSG